MIQQLLSLGVNCLTFQLCTLHMQGSTRIFSQEGSAINEELENKNGTEPKTTSVFIICMICVRDMSKLVDLIFERSNNRKGSQTINLLLWIVVSRSNSKLKS